MMHKKNKIEGKEQTEVVRSKMTDTKVEEKKTPAKDPQLMSLEIPKFQLHENLEAVTDLIVV